VRPHSLRRSPVNCRSRDVPRLIFHALSGSSDCNSCSDHCLPSKTVLLIERGKTVEQVHTVFGELILKA
jgi:hypothetical protein